MGNAKMPGTETAETLAREHAERISKLEQRGDSNESNISNVWKAVGRTETALNQVNVDIAKLSTTSTATLESTKTILAKVESIDKRAGELELTHAQVKGGMNALLGVAASIGAVIGGVVSGLATFMVTHFFSGTTSTHQ
jgi:septal ring factor EnvC (AmiA/AmiB activator)